MKCRIIDNRPNSAQKRALKKMVATEFNGIVDQYNRVALLQFAYVLRFGKERYGQKRLERTLHDLIKMQKDFDYRYELPEDDTPWLCEQKLIESGIDVKKLLGETNE